MIYRKGWAVERWITSLGSYLLNLRWQHIVKWVNKHLERDHILKSVEALQLQYLFFISAGGSQQIFYTLIILLRPSCIIKCLSIVVFFLFGEELKGCLKFWSSVFHDWAPQMKWNRMRRRTCMTMTLPSLAFFLKAARKLRNIPQSIPAVVIIYKEKTSQGEVVRSLSYFQGSWWCWAL